MIFEEYLKVIQEENEERNVEKWLKWHEERVSVFYKNYGISQEFIGAAGVKISCRSFPVKNSRGKILICTGFNESYVKYAECIQNFCEAGYSVYAFDHRGQGFSGRLPDQGKKGYIDRFENFIFDFQLFFEKTCKSENPHLPVFVLAHSMGGAIVSSAVSEGKIKPAGIIFCAPMFGIHLGSFTFLELPLYLLVESLCKFGYHLHYAFGQEDCIPLLPFEKNVVTHSKSRYLLWRKLISEWEELQLGGVTFGWVREAVRTTRKLQFTNMLFDVPVLLLQAGKDTLVDNAAHKKFLRLCSNAELLVFPFAKHEILMEVDMIRNQALNGIFKFIEKLSP